MRKFVLLLAAAVPLALAAGAAAHPDEADLYIPWTDQVTGDRVMRSFMGDDAVFQTEAAPADPGAEGMTLVGNSDKDSTTNSDLAFWGDLAYAGNYDGFRILDIRGPQPQVVLDYKCRGPQNDVSVYEIGGRRYLFQSIDTPQTSEDCATSADTPLWPKDNTKRTPGFEGIRQFDVTDPTRPQLVNAYQTACGSHTHTLVPGKKTLHIYIASYPLGSGVTPEDYTGDLPRCEPPHRKISIVDIKHKKPEEGKVREKALSTDTTFNRGFQACHDVQVHMPKEIAVASCAGDTQLWSIKNPGNPTSADGEPHTHIRSPSAEDQFEFMHSAFISWDGEKFGTMDETGGGVTAECDGAATQDGFYYFYEMVKPGQPAPELEARYTIPRPQTPEICVSHNGNPIPLQDGRDVSVVSYYQGGNTVIDWTDLDNVHEVAWSDLPQDAVGLPDSWSTYWYNGRVYVNGGLNRRGATGNRGVDVFTLDSPSLNTSERWRYSNPQTQEAFQVP
jgi:hypothetical protein